MPAFLWISFTPTTEHTEPKTECFSVISVHSAVNRSG
jgi:hypothetical protein